MPLYLVSYDLLHHKTYGQYEELIGEIRRLGGHHVLLSQFAIRRDETSVTLRDHFRQFMHADDRILVSEISATNWASFGLLYDINKV